MMARRRNQVVITSESTARYLCACGATNDFAFDPHLLHSQTPVRMGQRCACGRRRMFFLERRSAARKRVDLPGLCTVNGNLVPQKVVVRDLSRNGVLVELEDGAEVRLREHLLVEFVLEHGEVTRFRKPAAVRWVSGHEIGAEFVPSHPDREYEMALALHRLATPVAG